MSCTCQTKRAKRAKLTTSDARTESRVSHRPLGIQPAKVTFLDGETSDEYMEFTVAGRACIVRPESGMRLLESCPGCLWKNYGPIAHFDRVIDWEQWTGEDFFLVWPLTGHRLCTQRAAKWLEASGIQSIFLGCGFQLLEQNKNRLT